MEVHLFTLVLLVSCSQTVGNEDIKCSNTQPCPPGYDCESLGFSAQGRCTPSLNPPPQPPPPTTNPPVTETTSAPAVVDHCVGYTCKNGGDCTSWRLLDTGGIERNCTTIKTVTLPPACPPGFAMVGSMCEGCPAGEFKSGHDSGPCLPCPPKRPLTAGTNATNQDACFQETEEMWPAFGPIAGGTLLAIPAPGMDGLDIDRVTVVGLKCPLLADRTVVANETVFCKTLRVKKVKAGPVTVRMSNGHVIQPKGKFEYRPNPIIERLEKTKTVIGGGIVLTIHGTHLDSVAVPKLTVQRVLRDNTRYFSENCKVYDGSSIGCPTPDLRPGLPHGMLNQDQDGGSRSKRSILPYIRDFLTGLAVKSRERREVKPRSYNDDWGMQFHLGFGLDGEDSYGNVSKTMPGVGQLTVYPDPVIHKFDEVDHIKKFSPDNHPIVLINGKDLDYAAEIHDYQALVGVEGVCNITVLVSNALTCRPPYEPPDHEPSWPGPNQEPRLRVHIGNREFFVGYLSYSDDADFDFDPVVVGVAAAIGVVMLLLLSTIMCYCHRRRMDQRDKNLILQHGFPPQQGNFYSDGMHPPGGYMRPRSSLTGSASTYSGSSRMPLILSLRGSTSTGSPPPTPGTGSMYSEPMTPSWQNNVAYLSRAHLSGDVTDQIGEDLKLTLEGCRIEPDRLVIGHVIGQGHFGMVHFGELLEDNKETWRTVAIKTIQGKTGSIEEVTSFLEEAVVMKDFSHPNVLSLLGVVVKDNKPYVVLPFMEHGDLKTYISEPKRKITVRELVAFGVQVADGMNYLTEQKFVHRDLATRNCMINKSYIVKIADFGLSRDIYKSDYYRLEDKHRPLPVKWMAIESLQHGVFSIKSDVWSFGVLMWELLTRGCGPYPDIDAFNVKKYLLAGNRLSQPEHAPDEVFAVMSTCWHELPENRPTFTELYLNLKNIVNDEGQQDANYLKLI